MRKVENGSGFTACAGKTDNLPEVFVRFHRENGEPERAGNIHTWLF
jgi:hypothetical protein